MLLRKLAISTPILILGLVGCGGGGSESDGAIVVGQGEPAVCIDVAPINDGIGFNGTVVCEVPVIGSPTPPTANEDPEPGICVDIEPVNDGVGFNGVQACTVPIIPAVEPIATGEVAGECVDTPPLNDGIGWNGIASCPTLITGNEVVSCNTGTQLVGNTCVITGPLDPLDPDLDGDNNPDTFPCTEAFESGDGSEIIGDGFGWNGVSSCNLPVIEQARGVCADHNLNGELTDNRGTCSLPQPQYMRYSRIYDLKKATRSPVVDGVFDVASWDRALYFRAASIVSQAQAEPLSDTQLNALSASGNIKHDGDWLYLLVSIDDPSLFTDSPLNQLHQDDGWELFIDAGGENNHIYDSNDYQLLGDWALNRSSHTPRLLDGFHSQLSMEPQVQCQSQGIRRTCEIRLSLASLGALGPVDSTMGLDIHFNNDVDGGERDFKIGWCGAYVHDVLWFDTSAMGCGIRVRHF